MQSLDRLLGLLGWVPLWLWIALAAVALGAWVKFFGWRGALPALAAVVTLGLLVQVRRGGWEAREKEGAENVTEMVKRARIAREATRRAANSKPERLHDNDGYRRD